MSALLWKLGAISAGSSVAIAAAGGHKPWEVDRKLTFNTAFTLHLSSAIGMMLASARGATIPGYILLVGSGLFSFTSYYRCMNNDKKYNYLMPYGGSLIILSWAAMALY